MATDDGKLVRKDHFGSSRYFQIIEILNGEIANWDIDHRQSRGLEM